MPTPPSSPEEGEEENAIFDPSEEENNNDITSALENEDIEDDNDESNENNNENNETITNLQESFQTRITTVSPLLFPLSSLISNSAKSNLLHSYSNTPLNSSPKH
jgi:hypothetical protein